MDIFSKAKRSQIMSKIKGKNTRVEVIFIKELRRRRIKGFKLYYDIIGKPDVVFLKQKIAIFIDGDFWHGKNFSKWKHKLSAFWLDKISGNIKRDKSVRGLLRSRGWTVLRFWDVDILRNLDKCIDRMEEKLNEKRKAFGR